MGVLDLGSSSFHLLVADTEADGSIFPVSRERTALGLGSSLDPRGAIPTERAVAALDAVRHLLDVARRAGAERVEAVATSALRDAENGAALTTSISADTGIPIRLLTGAEEARLSFIGMRGSVAFPPGRVLGLDLGGGSLELAVGSGAAITHAVTLPVGVDRLRADLVPGVAELDQAERAAVHERVEKELTRAESDIEVTGAGTCVATGGTVKALARLAANRRGSVPSINQLRLRRKHLDELADEVRGSSLDDRLNWSGMSARRAELLPIGVEVLLAVLDALDHDGVTVSEWGLREGVILDALGCDEPPGATPGRLRETSVLRLRERWHADDAHSDQVTTLATELFDQTAHLHELGVTDRELLVHAARLHDIGAQVALDEHHHHGAYLVENGHLRGFSPKEVAVLASLVRFHRGGGPKTSYLPFASLSRRRRDHTIVLTGILRVADGLERGHEQVVRLLRVEEAGDSVLRIHVHGPTPADLVRWGDDLKTRLLSRALQRRVEVLPDVDPAGQETGGYDGREGPP